MCFASVKCCIWTVLKTAAASNSLLEVQVTGKKVILACISTCFGGILSLNLVGAGLDHPTISYTENTEISSFRGPMLQGVAFKDTALLPDTTYCGNDNSCQKHISADSITSVSPQEKGRNSTHRLTNTHHILLSVRLITLGVVWKCLLGQSVSDLQIWAICFKNEFAMCLIASWWWEAVKQSIGNDFA